MSVHIDELHTQLRSTGALPDGPAGQPAPGGQPADERAAEERRRAAWLACRVAAEGFDD
jgi:hypothetical protein